MNSILSTPLEEIFTSWSHRITPAHKWGFLVAMIVTVLAFGFEMSNLTLHHDDVGQIFNQDRRLGHYLGRFGLGWLHIGYPLHSSLAVGLVESVSSTMVSYVAGPMATAC